MLMAKSSEPVQLPREMIYELKSLGRGGHLTPRDITVYMTAAALAVDRRLERASRRVSEVLGVHRKTAEMALRRLRQVGLLDYEYRALDPDRPGRSGVATTCVLADPARWLSDRGSGAGKAVPPQETRDRVNGAAGSIFSRAVEEAAAPRPQVRTKQRKDKEQVPSTVHKTEVVGRTNSKYKASTHPCAPPTSCCDALPGVGAFAYGEGDGLAVEGTSEAGTTEGTSGRGIPPNGHGGGIAFDLKAHGDSVDSCACCERWVRIVARLVCQHGRGLASDLPREAPVRSAAPDPAEGKTESEPADLSTEEPAESVSADDPPEAEQPEHDPDEAQAVVDQANLPVRLRRSNPQGFCRKNPDRTRPPLPPRRNGFEDPRLREDGSMHASTKVKVNGKFYVLKDLYEIVEARRRSPKARHRAWCGDPPPPRPFTSKIDRVTIYGYRRTPEQRREAYAWAKSCLVWQPKPGEPFGLILPLANYWTHKKRGPQCLGDRKDVLWDVAMPRKNLVEFHRVAEEHDLPLTFDPTDYDQTILFLRKMGQFDRRVIGIPASGIEDRIRDTLLREIDDQEREKRLKERLIAAREARMKRRDAEKENQMAKKRAGVPRVVPIDPDPGDSSGDPPIVQQRRSVGQTRESGGRRSSPKPRRPKKITPGPDIQRVYDEWAALVEEKFGYPKVEIDGRAAKLISEMLGVAGLDLTVKVVRVAAYDWLAIQETIMPWYSAKRPMPTIEAIYYLFKQLLGFLKTGVVSPRHRVSAYAQRFVPKTPDTPAQAKQAAEAEAESPGADPQDLVATDEETGKRYYVHRRSGTDPVWEVDPDEPITLPRSMANVAELLEIAEIAKELEFKQDALGMPLRKDIHGKWRRLTRSQMAEEGFFE